MAMVIVDDRINLTNKVHVQQNKNDEIKEVKKLNNA